MLSSSIKSQPLLSGFGTLLLAVLALVGPAQCRYGFSIREFRVPAIAMNGTDVTLECIYTGKLKLYAVKWYRNGEEFYRFLFDSHEPQTSFDQPGIKVDLGRSNESRVTLKSVNFNTTGLFRCEVSAEEPDFDTKYAVKNMTVIQLSGDGPFISGLRERYELNEQLNVNCTSPSVSPSNVNGYQPRLVWQLNDESVEGQTRQLTSNEDRTSTLATINLRLILTERHFNLETGLLKLTCSFSVGKGKDQMQYNKSEERMAALIHPTVIEPRPTHRSSKGKDYRSASYSAASGGRSMYGFCFVAFLSVIPHALRACS